MTYSMKNNDSAERSVYMKFNNYADNCDEDNVKNNNIQGVSRL
jgi:hypothetical protein